MVGHLLNDRIKGFAYGALVQAWKVETTTGMKERIEKFYIV
ncbi:MAG: hypothetical protein K1000chlam4_00435, partial [Chlamydiae bacterium]|nr:hypothetical protein [Chlamydiota bacterium]